MSAVERHDVEKLLDQGATLTHYVPHHTHIVALSSAAIARASAHPLVAWIGAVQPAHKVHGSLIEHVWQMTVSRTDECEWNIVLVDAIHSAAVRQLAADHGVEVVDEIDGGKRLIVAVPALEVREARRLLAALVESERVFSVERRLKHGARNKYATWLTQSGIKEKRSVWAHGIRGEGQIVGCADSGLDVNHCFFNDPSQPKFSSSREESSAHRKVIAYYAFDGADFTDDVGGHGSHVVGSIAGKAYQPNNPTEERVIGESNGAAPEAKIVFHDIGKTNGGLTVDSDVMDSKILQPAYRLGARIHSNSWGCSGQIDVCNRYDGGAAAVDKFVWENRDMLVLFAAGNDGQNAAAMTQTVGSPATAKSALVIGAQQSTYESFEEAITFFDWAERKKQAEEALMVSNLDCCNPPSGTNERAIRKFCCADAAKQALVEDKEHLGENSVAEFSSRGPTFDGRIKPDLLAPGQNIVSTHSDGRTDGGDQCGLQPPLLDNNAARLTMQGTSMATPHAAGNAALVRQYLTDGFYPSGTKKPSDAMPKPSGAVIKALMIASTVELTGSIDKGNNGTWSRVDPIWPRYSIFQGFGALRLGNALKFADDNRFDMFLDDVWAGAPASMAGPGLESNGTQTYCFTPTDNSKIRAVLVYDDYPASPGAKLATLNNLNLIIGHTDDDKVSGNFQTFKDSRNTNEHAFFESPQTGKPFYVQVRAYNVPQGPQPYAVVILGRFASVKKNCEWVIQDDFADATPGQYFPYGEVIGTAAGLSVLGLVLMAVIRILLKK
jgi:subtilisin family serine protease